MNPPSQDRVPLLSKLAYAAPAYALAVVGIPVYVYIPKFYTDVVGINVLAMGYILFSVRIFDALTDPAMGYLSDRTRTAFGRRRPYLALGSVCIALTMMMLFNPPDIAAPYQTLWFAVSIYGLFLFWTVVTVPYESLGPEMTFDHNERVSLFGIRDGFLMAGTLAAAAPAIMRAVFNLPDDAAGERQTFYWISVWYAPLIIVSSWWCAARIKENPPITSTPSSGMFQSIRQVGKNKPFIILLIAYTISAVGNNLPATLILYYVEYVLQSQKADFFLLLYFVTGIVFLPAWIKVAQRAGKKRAWLASMAVNTGAFVGVFFLGPGDENIYAILVCLSGIGFGATLAIPSAIQADVIDYDELLSGQRREGQYIGLWSVAKKMAAALGVGVGLTVLGTVGYTPNAVQTEQVQWTLRVLYALVPSVFNLIGFGVALLYPIDREAHAKIREAIRQREKGGPFLDPLKPMDAAA